MTNNRDKNILLIIVAFLLLFPLIFVTTGNNSSMADKLKFELGRKDNLSLSLGIVDKHIKVISSDPGNELVLKLEIKDSEGNPVPGAGFNISALINKNAFSATTGYTDRNGYSLLIYRPSILPAAAYKNGQAEESVSVNINGTNIKEQVTFKLSRIPVVLIHGYQSNSSIFESLEEFLVSNGFPVKGFNYESKNGVSYGANQLALYIDKIKEDYLKAGLQVNKVDLIGHSMGGLVARYYTCSPEYTIKSYVDKIIFISVPQNGSSLASLGLKYYNDEGIHDLIPDSNLFTKLFPSFKNGGLNNKIQTGSILGQYDEVVSTESASLEEWGIKTELFNVGDNNFTVDKLLSGKFAEASNHKTVLFNKKVFNRVREMLDTELDYPIRK